MKRLLFICLIGLFRIAEAAPELVGMPYFYLPLSQQELGLAFPLHKVVKPETDDSTNVPSVPAGQGVATITWEDMPESDPLDILRVQPLSLQGKDLAGKQWEVILAGVTGCFPARIYHADLDKNGMEDVIIVRGTCGNGLAEPIWLDLITFERNGRPLMLSFTGFFEDQDQHFNGLRDLNHDGKADLIEMDVHDGYWSTNIYQINDGRWQRVTGKFMTRRYPLYTRYTDRPNNKPVTPRKAVALSVRDFSNSKPSITGDGWSITTENAGNPKQAKARWLRCYTDEAIIITLESKEGRTIYTSYANATTLRDLQDTATTEQSKVQLFGLVNARKCGPKSVWLEK
jgi:hypothetical protein